MKTNPILIAYASRYGSTQEIAETLSSTLREAGFAVDLQPMEAVNTLDGYEAVVLGAGIYSARWHASAHQFLARFQHALAQLPVYIFALGPLNKSSAALRSSRRQLDGELAQYRWLKPAAVEIFAGKYDPSNPGLGFFERLIPASDHRDWNAIRSWAQALAAQLGEKKKEITNA